MNIFSLDFYKKQQKSRQKPVFSCLLKKCVVSHEIVDNFMILLCFFGVKNITLDRIVRFL